MSKTTKDIVTIRSALPDDTPALTRAIALIDEETEFLGKPGEFQERWAPGFAERVRAMNEKGTGVYMLAQDGEEIGGFLGAFCGFFESTRGAVYIGHVGL